MVALLALGLCLALVGLGFGPVRVGVSRVQTTLLGFKPLFGYTVVLFGFKTDL